MLRPATDWQGLTIVATDGEIGTVQNLFFDDGKWTVRYVVADTGTLLPGRRVLVSPMAVVRPDFDARRVEVRLTREQIEKAPDVETDRPVSRQEQIRQEQLYHQYYGWPYYWGGAGLWGASTVPAGMLPPAGPPPPTPAEEARAAATQGDPHLRSTQEVLGYYIEARDGDIGHVEDFLIDDESWAVRYLLVDTRNWWPGKKVLVSPEWVADIRWADSRVRVALSREEIRNAPEYDPSVPPDRAYEERLWASYGRPGYWSGPAAAKRTRRRRA